MNILLLRGLGRNQYHWGEFPQSLLTRKTSPSIQMHFLDLPGLGENSSLPAPLNIAQTLKPLRIQWEQIKKKSHSEPWIILGISMGAMVALEWMNQYPDDFKNGILINTSSRDSGRPWHRLKVSAWPHFIRIANTKSTIKREQEVWTMTSKKKLDSKIIHQWVSNFDRYPVKKIEGLKQLLASARFKSPQNIKPKTLFLTSMGDQMVDPNCSYFLANKYNSHLEVHPTAGHDLPLDDPNWVWDKILKFLNM